MSDGSIDQLVKGSLWTSFISVRVFALPLPRVGTGIVNRLHGLPFQFFVRLLGIRNYRRQIAGASSDNCVRNFLPRRLFKRSDQFEHGIPSSCAQVVHQTAAFGLREELVQGLHVTLRKVFHMQVVPHTCSVNCWPVVSEYAQLFFSSHCHLLDEGKEVCRDLGRLSDAPTRVGSDWVEVPEDGDLPVLVGRVEVGEDLLHHEFGLSVWIRGSEFCGLCQRRL
mmetsp:Transcript_15500/g.31468  ORF Transcript_15500/g.31468 Transcript_15500/m.31468 type:complete len:223 (+) Transcript_15500:380-1048(+)